MKKLLSLILAVLMLAMGTVAFADGSYYDNATESQDVYVDIDSVNDPSVVAFDISWTGDYQFTLKTGGRTWNAGEIKYEDSTANPTFENNNPPTVTVTNRSNIGIYATCTVAPAEHVPEDVLTFVNVGEDKHGYHFTSAFAAASETNEAGELIYSLESLPTTVFVVSFEVADDVTSEQLNAILTAFNEEPHLATIIVEVTLDDPNAEG